MRCVLVNLEIIRLILILRELGLVITGIIESCDCAVYTAREEVVILEAAQI